jgi:hypothetical protein
MYVYIPPNTHSNLVSDGNAKIMKYLIFYFTLLMANISRRPWLLCPGMEESKQDTWVLQERRVLFYKREKGLPTLPGGRGSTPEKKRVVYFRSVSYHLKLGGGERLLAIIWLSDLRAGMEGCGKENSYICDLASLTFEPGKGVGFDFCIHPMVILKCPTTGRKFPFFLTYYNYNGTLKACHGGVSVPSFPTSSLPQIPPASYSKKIFLEGLLRGRRSIFHTCFELTRSCRPYLLGILTPITVPGDLVGICCLNVCPV